MRGRRMPIPLCVGDRKIHHRDGEAPRSRVFSRPLCGPILSPLCLTASLVSFLIPPIPDHPPDPLFWFVSAKMIPEGEEQERGAERE